MDGYYGTYVDDEHIDNHSCDDADDDTYGHTGVDTNHKHDSNVAVGVAHDAGAAPFQTRSDQTVPDPKLVYVSLVSA